MHMRRLLCALAACAATVSLSGCTMVNHLLHPPITDTDDTPATENTSTVVGGASRSIPQAWLDAAAEGWPSSEAYSKPYDPITSYSDANGTCLLDGDLPTPFGTTPRSFGTGWGSLDTDKEGYRYSCEYYAPGKYATSLVLMAGNADAVDEAITTVKNTTSDSVQDNSVETVEIGDVSYLVLTTWFPTNPQGKYLVLFHDEAADAIVAYDLNAAKKADFEELGAEGAAQLLDDFLASAQ